MNEANLAGPGVDSQGRQVLDPTKNVLDLVDAAIKRQDDLREQEAKHSREIDALRADYENKLRLAETARIDAIRAVDVGAVSRAAEVSATQAATLAAQVATSAETLRVSVQTAATAAGTALAAALGPIIKDIADLRRVQYEQVGQRAQVSEHREERGESRLNLGTVFGGISLALVLLFGVFSIANR